MVTYLGVMLVVTGWPRSNETQRSEVIDLDRPDYQCESLGDFPIQTYGATGGLINGEPLICGGYANPSSSGCFTIGNSDPLANLTMTNRQYTSSLVIDQGKTLWVTGGHWHFENTTESVSLTDGVTVTSGLGLELPKRMHNHCIVKLKESAAVMIGGSHTRNSTWIYNFEEKSWTEGPSLIRGRRDHVCGLIKDSVLDKEIVIAASGYEYDIGISNSTEIWITGTDSWVQGPELPMTGVVGASGLVSDDGKHFILVGGGGTHYQELFYIYKLQCFNLECKWEKMEQELEVARSHTVAMLIPQEKATCKEKHA